MTRRLIVSCDGSWDGGRMPCRGALPVATMLEPAETYARRHGWTVGPDGDWCPAHSRRAAS